MTTSNEDTTTSENEQSDDSTTEPRVAPAENSTDAHRGEPLAMRAQQRRGEFAAALAEIPAEEHRTRSDIEVAMSSIDALLTGDVENLSGPTAAALSRLLERTKHLAETTPTAVAQ
jgi:hypothetical protein